MLRFLDPDMCFSPADWSDVNAVGTISINQVTKDNKTYMTYAHRPSSIPQGQLELRVKFIFYPTGASYNTNFNRDDSEVVLGFTFYASGQVTITVIVSHV